MTRPNTTDITVILDRSGSMESLRDDTIGGFNRFLTDQQGIPGSCRLTLVQFDSAGIDTIYLARPVVEAPALTRETYMPRGGTPLLDAMGDTFNQVGRRLAVMPEIDRPHQVIMVIITDGRENESHRFTKRQVFEIIDHQKTRYGWVFMYLGANQDAIAEAAGYGIHGSYAMDWSPTAKGVNSTYRVASQNVGAMRSSGAGGQTLNANASHYGFTPEQRAQAMADIVAEAAKLGTMPEDPGVVIPPIHPDDKAAS